MVEIKRKDGGTCHCYGHLEDGDNYFIVTENNNFIWTEYDSKVHGKTWYKVVSYLHNKLGWKVEQIEFA